MQPAVSVSTTQFDANERTSVFGIPMSLIRVHVYLLANVRAAVGCQFANKYT